MLSKLFAIKLTPPPSYTISLIFDYLPNLVNVVTLYLVGAFSYFNNVCFTKLLYIIFLFSRLSG